MHILLTQELFGYDTDEDMIHIVLVQMFVSRSIDSLQ